MQTPLAKPIAVLGAGSWGSALALSLAKNPQEVRLWDHDESLLLEITKARSNPRYLPGVPFPKNIVVCKTISDACDTASDILIVVPSHAFSDALTNLKPFLKPEHRLISATKGLHPSGALLHSVAAEILGTAHPYAVISGPSFAKEVALGLPTAVALATKDPAFQKALMDRFSHDTFRVYPTDDVIGVQLGGVVKNVIAVAVGVSDGVQFGANARAALITQGLAEMVRLGEALGARAETLMGLAGCGDVILTCTDNQSRNRRFGLALAEGLTEAEALKQIGQVVEAVYNVEQLSHLAETQGVELPIVQQVFRIVKQGVAPGEAIGALFRRIKVV